MIKEIFFSFYLACCWRSCLFPYWVTLAVLCHREGTGGLGWLLSITSLQANTVLLNKEGRFWGSEERTGEVAGASEEGIAGMDFSGVLGRGVIFLCGFHSQNKPFSMHICCKGKDSPTLFFFFLLQFQCVSLEMMINYFIPSQKYFHSAFRTVSRQ